MICLDASVVGIIISPDEQSAVALKRYEQARLKGEIFIAPALLPFEIASLLRKKELRLILTGAEVLASYRFYRELGIRLVEDEGIVERSLALSQTFGKDLTVYDASYLAVAEQKNASLWTADRKFFELVFDTLANVELLG